MSLRQFEILDVMCNFLKKPEKKTKKKQFKGDSVEKNKKNCKEIINNNLHRDNDPLNKGEKKSENQSKKIYSIQY